MRSCVHSRRIAGAGPGAKAPQCRQRDAGSQNNLRWAAPERSAATGADMWVSHRTGRPPGAVIRSGEAYEDLLAALDIAGPVCMMKPGDAGFEDCEACQ